MGFIEHLDEGISRLQDSPRLFRAVYGEVRRMALKRFPYFLWFIYFDDANVVQIVAVTHQRRDSAATRL